MLSGIMLGVAFFSIMLSDIRHCAECHYAECRLLSVMAPKVD
jgi:hypothetical protein